MKENLTYSPELQQFIDVYHLAYDSGDATAQFALAKILIKSNEPNARKNAFATFKKLANHNYTTVQTDARFMLAVCYENGYGIRKNYPLAIKWYKIVGCSVSDDVNYAYKKYKECKEIIDKRMDKAIEEFKKRKITTPEMLGFLIESAESGDVAAQKQLMNLYKFGDKNIEVDEEEVAHWAQKAAKNGDAQAMDELGRMYYYGQGVERNFRKGLDLMELAANKGELSSAYHLGRHHEKIKAYKKATEWYRLYAQLELKYRNKSLGREDSE